MTDDPRERARRLLIVDIDGCSPKNTARYIEDLRECIYRLLAVVPPPPQEPTKAEEDTRVDDSQYGAQSGTAANDKSAPLNAPPWVDTPVRAAQRRAFDDPTHVNLDALVEAVRAETDPPSPAPRQTADETREAEMSEQLLPCPFCGGRAIRLEGDGRWCQIGCDGCGGRGTEYPNDWAAAERAWNTRPASSLTPADLIALRDKWRVRAIKEREDALQPVAFSAMRKAIGNGIAAVYDSCADQLDALITRLSSETEKEK